MTYYEIMPSTKSRYNSENELIFERGKKKIYRGFQALLWEITENYRRVSALLGSAWVLCSCCICTLQYAIQENLSTLEEKLKCCKSDIIYEPSFSTRLSKYFSFPTNNKIPEHTECMCNKRVTKAEIFEIQRNAGVVTSWLRRNSIRVSFNDVTQWNDGTLMWKILKRISIRKFPITDLDSSKKLENWTLLGTVIKHRYPGLIQNEILLRCLASSDPVCLYHVIYILTRMMNAHRRTWKGYMIKMILNAANVFKRFLSPRFHISGPGIIHAKVNIKNEFIIRTDYVCPPFTIEVEDASGEIWRENSYNAKLNNRHDEGYTSDCLTDCEKPIEVVRVTRFFYRIFFIIRTEGECRISVRPGINKGGHIHGSPFIVATNSSVIQRCRILEEDALEKITPTLRISSQTTPRKRLTGQSAVLETGMENSYENSNGHSIRDVDDAVLSEGNVHLTPSSSRFGIRKMTVAVLRHITTGITTVSHRVVSTIRKSSSEAESGIPKSSSLKRKTHVSVFDRPNASNVRKGGSGLNMPSSRNFKIRSVTVHKYLNTPMPSLEEYFLGQGGFSVDSESGVCDAGKRWSTISSLLRAKMRMMSRIERPNTLTKRRVSDSVGLHKRRPQLRRSQNVYDSRRLRSRHSSDDVFWRKGTRIPSSSSSEDDRDVFADIPEDDNFHTPTKVTGDSVTQGDMPRQRRYPVSDNDTRFHHLFRDEGGAADLLFQNGVTSSNSGRHNHNNSPQNYKSKPRHSSDRRISYSALCRESKARRSGYSMCQPDSFESQSNETNNNTIERTCAEFAEKTAINVMKMAGDEYVKSKVVLKEYKR